MQLNAGVTKVKMDDASRESELRQTIAAKPKHARAMAELACLLVQQQKQPQQQQEEALQWAHNAATIAPHKPFGYAALSLVEPEFDVRVKYLRLAIQQSYDAPPQNNRFLVARFGLLTRLLTEPRQHEGTKVRGTIGKASPLHPTRRPLNCDEEIVHQQIESTVASIVATSSPAMAATAKQNELLGHWNSRLGLFFRKINGERAASYFTAALDYLDNDGNARDVAQFWLATLDSNSNAGVVASQRCPQSYVVGLYSTFASRFDELLVKQLGYQTPQKLRQLLHNCSSSNIPKATFNCAIDLGCGTGLSGAAFADLVAKHLHGVDLSPEMIAQAKDRGCYQQLTIEDAVSFLTNYNKSNNNNHLGDGSGVTTMAPGDDSPAQPDLDLIFSCDVFCYLGDLQPVFFQAHRVLTTNGVFCCSTELLLPDENATGTKNTPTTPSTAQGSGVNSDSGSSVQRPFLLHECARFAHTSSYVTTLAVETGFTVVASQVCAIRKNQGKDVSGFLVVLQKQN